MIVTKEHIERFIPQRAPFIMVDNLINATPDRFETDFKILSDNIFLEDGVLREFALIENIAQSSAAGFAMINNQDRKKPVNGFIGGISKLNVYGLPVINDTIQTSITPIAQLGDMFMVKAEIFADGRKLIECEVKLVGPPIRKKQND